MIVDIVAASALSGLGSGALAYSVGEVGAEPRSAIEADPMLVEALLKKPFASRVRTLDAEPVEQATFRDRAELLLERVAEELGRALDDALPDWQSRRVGLIVGTSAGGMPSSERVFAERDGARSLAPGLARAAPYFGPMPLLSARLGILPERVVQVLAACASSTVAIGLGCRWLELGRADLVIAGGYDALTVFVAAGFEALGATSAARPAPFRRERDGMAIGEGAGLVALVPGGTTGSKLGCVLGFGASSDAVHVTAPDRSGTGLARAARAALEDAGIAGSGVDLVSAHGTATPFNDAAEAKALNAALGAHVERAVVHPFKAVIGHTLGAAGVLETLAALDAIRRGILPASLGTGEREPELRARLLERNERGTPHSCLKLSAAFGGANAALVVAAHGEARAPRAAKSVRVAAIGQPCQALDVERVIARCSIDRTKLARLDPVSALAVAAASSVLELVPEALPARTGVVIGTAAATLEVNERYDARRRARGARAVEPRRFPATSPNLCAGEVSIAFGLRGPSFTVGASLAAATEALIVACDLLACGDADAFLVVAVDAVGPVVSDIWRAAGWPLPEPGALAALLCSDAGEHRPLDLERMLAAHRDACRASGALAGCAPGWPALRKALGD